MQTDQQIKDSAITIKSNGKSLFEIFMEYQKKSLEKSDITNSLELLEAGIELFIKDPKANFLDRKSLQEMCYIMDRQIYKNNTEDFYKETLLFGFGIIVKD